MMMLSGVYYAGSFYYTCGRFTSHFSLTYFNSNSIALQSCVAIILIFIQIIFLQTLFFLSKKWNVNVLNKIALDLDKNASKIKINSKSNLKSSSSRERNRKLNNISNTNHKTFPSQTSSQVQKMRDRQIERESYQKCQIYISNCCWALLWITGYLLSLLMTIFCIIAENLPNDNTLDLSQSTAKTLLYSIAFILTLTSIYITPRMADSLCKYNYKYDKYGKSIENLHNYNNSNCRNWTCDCCCDCCDCSNRTLFIAILRSFLSFIFPFILSVLMLDGCGKYWTSFWNPCVNGQKTFDIFYNNTYMDIYNHTTSDGVNGLFLWSEKDTIRISSHKDVCTPTNFLDFIDTKEDDNDGVNNVNNINTCLRQFYDLWVPVVAVKLFLALLNPWVMMGIKYYKIESKMKNLCIKLFTMICCCLDCCFCCYCCCYYCKCNYNINCIGCCGCNCVLCQRCNDHYNRRRYVYDTSRSGRDHTIRGAIGNWSLYTSLFDNYNINSLRHPSKISTNDKSKSKSFVSNFNYGDIEMSNRLLDASNVDHNDMMHGKHKVTGDIKKNRIGGRSDNLTASINSNDIDLNIDIDSQYGMIITKLEMCILFGVFSPYLLFIAGMAIVSNYLCYHIIAKQLKWRITYSKYPVPIRLLVLSVVFEQCFIIAFCWNLFHKGVLGFFSVSFVVCDVVFAMKSFVHSQWS